MLFLLYSPLNQGLKLISESNFQLRNPVFTLQSIKSRIETDLHQSPNPTGNPVFTLQSIKSRIETKIREKTRKKDDRFLLYSPLNQGLKLLL